MFIEWGEQLKLEDKDMFDICYEIRKFTLKIHCV